MPVFPQDPKINANIITANSKEELPDPSTVKEGTVALIPSVAQSVYVYDSLDAAAAANLPEGSLVAVPSNTVGLEVVELTTTVAIGVSFTSEENALLNAAWKTGKAVLIKCNLDMDSVGVLTNFCAVAMRGISSGAVDMALFGLTFGSIVVQIYSIMDNGKPGTWGVNLQTV